MRQVIFFMLLEVVLNSAVLLARYLSKLTTNTVDDDIVEDVVKYKDDVQSLIKSKL